MKYTILLTGAILAPFTGCATVTADDPVDEVLVTGSRTPIRAEEMTSSVTIFTATDITDLQITEISDLLRQVPGLTVSRAGAIGSQAELRMRGAEANHLLILIDGIEANDPASADAFLFEHLSVLNIERIEIIRGPQSALWGSDAVSGVVNIITKRGASSSKFQSQVETGSFGTLRGSIDFSQKKQDWHYAFGGTYLQSNGTNNAREGDERDGYENLGLYANLQASLAQNLILSANMRLTDARNEYDGVDYFTSGLTTDGDYVTFSDRLYYILGLEHNGKDGKWQQKLTYSGLTSDNENIAFGAENGRTKAQKDKLSYQATYNPLGKHQFTAALDHEVTTFRQEGAASPWGDPNQRQKISNTGYLIDYVGRWESDLTVLASWRRDENSDFADITTWRGGASYQFQETSRLFANFSRGQKAPGFIDRFGYFPGQFLGNPNLQPEYNNSFEIGYAYRAENGRLNIDISYFNAQLKDEIDGFVFDLDTFLYTAENKESDSKREGLEVSVSSKVNERVSFFSNYTYTKATEDDGTGSQRQELRRPKHMGSLGVTYSVSDGFTASVTANFVGKKQDIFFPPWPNPSEIVEMESYSLVRIAGSYPITDKVVLYGRVENALNANYEDLIGFNTPGRGAYVGMRFAF